MGSDVVKRSGSSNGQPWKQKRDRHRNSVCSNPVQWRRSFCQWNLSMKYHFLMRSHMESVIAIVLRIHILPARVSLCETIMVNSKLDFVTDQRFGKLKT